MRSRVNFQITKCPLGKCRYRNYVFQTHSNWYLCDRYNNKEPILIAKLDSGTAPSWILSVFYLLSIQTMVNLVVLHVIFPSCY